MELLVSVGLCDLVGVVQTEFEAARIWSEEHNVHAKDAEEMNNDEELAGSWRQCE